MRAQVNEEIERWRNLDIIKETTSGFNIPLIILRKPDKSIRISLDARSLNKLLIQDRFPLPHLSVVLTEIGTRLSSGRSCYISQIDCHRGYWQIQTAQNDMHKLAFSFNNRHYAATRLLYGVSTAPSAFSRIMAKLMDHPSILLYLDDIICIDSSFDEHLKTLEFIFTTCINTGLLLSAKKCLLCRTQADFLGYSISAKGIQPTDKHLKVIKNLKAPTSRAEVKRMLGTVNYNIKFVRDGSSILQPLYELTSKNVEFSWEEKHDKAFQTVKSELLKQPTLAHFQLGKELVLVSDSSGKKVGGVLYQKDGDNMNILGYFSRALTGPDLKRSMRIKELFALAFSISHFEYFLLNTHFSCVVDHKSLLFLFKEQRDYKNNDIKLTNIHNYLLKFDFTILHEPGTSPIMCTADYLSRLESYECNDLEKDSENFEDIPETVFLMHTQLASKTDTVFSFSDRTFTKEEFKQLQLECKKTRSLIEKCKMNPKTVFSMKNNLLHKQNRLVLPEDVSKEFLNYLHIYTCHAGCKQLNMMVRKFYIHNVHQLTRDTTTYCSTCINTKPMSKLRPSMIKNRHFESVPFTKTFFDLMDFGQKDSNGKRYLLTCCDSLTSYLDGFPLGTKTDAVVSKNILQLILRHGITNDVFTDNGSEFGYLVSEVFRKFELRHARTTAYRSNSNGMLERQHREVNSKLKLLNADHRNWSSAWPMVRYYVNNLPKSTLDGRSANECYFGRQFHVPFKTDSLQIGSREKWLTCLNKYFEKLHPSITAFQVSRYQKLVDRDVNNCPILEIGSKCLVWKPALRKLNRVWFGPYIIKRRISKDSYIVKDTETHREYRRHVSLLRPLRPNLAQTEDSTLDITTMTKDSGKIEDQIVHDVNELNDVCPGDDSRTQPWSTRLRQRRK